MDEEKYQINNQGQVRGQIIGDKNIITQNFYDKTGRGWNTQLILVRDLKSESFKLGDNAAAKFPFVISPVQAPYNGAVQGLYNAANKADYAKHGVLIFGESNAGKTRLVLEALKDTLPSWPVLRWRPDYTNNDIPPVEFLSNKQIVLFLDDLQDYMPAQMIGDEFKIADPHTTALRSLIEILLQSAQRLVIVGTCRSENRLQVQTALYWLFELLTNIDFPNFSANPYDSQARRIISEFQKYGVIHREDWDGTLGSLVLGLATKKSQYLALPPLTKKILQAMKLLNIVTMKVYTEHLLRAVCAGVFAEKRLIKDEQAWQEAISHLTQIQFVKEEVDEKSWESVLVIRKDAYFEQVITDYPQSKRPYQIIRNLVQLRKVLRELRDVQALLNLARSFAVLERRYDETLITVEHILALDPDNADAWYFKGGSFGNLDRDEEAVEALDRALALDPDNADAWHLKGAALAGLKRYEEAVEALDRALALDPNNANAWHLKGTILASLERYEEAVEAFNRALALDPDNAAAWFLKGYSLGTLGRHEEAVEALDRALALDPDNAAAWFLKGGSFGTLDRYEEAVEAFDRALALDPDNAAAWHLKGVSFGNLGRHEEAVEAIGRALALDPDNADAWHLKGTILYTSEQEEKAIEAFDRALALDPSNATAWYRKGAALADLKLDEEAIEAFDRALALDPDNADTWHLKAVALSSLKQYEEAIKALDRALALDPDNAVAWRLKAVVLQELDQYGKAIEALDRALALDPNGAAWFLKAVALSGLKRDEEAIEALDRALALDPDNAAAWCLKGYSLGALAQFEEAMEALDRALALDPNNAVILDTKSTVLRRLELEVD